MSGNSGAHRPWKRNQATAAETGTGTTANLDTKGVGYAVLDITIQAITGGTTPNITFAVDRLGGDDIWYQIATTSALTAVGSTSLVLVPSGANAAVFSNVSRVRWTFGGGVPATSIAFSGSLTGRDF